MAAPGPAPAPTVSGVAAFPAAVTSGRDAGAVGAPWTGRVVTAVRRVAPTATVDRPTSSPPPRGGVQVPDEADWHVTGPFHSYGPLPVPAALVRELYVDIGLSIHHIALLIGLGDFATRNRLIQAGVTFTASQERGPWNRRRYTD